MAVPVVASSATTIDEATGTTFTMTAASGIVSGDVIYLVVATDSTSATQTTPTGFTAEGDIVSSVNRVYLFSKRADGTEGATFTSTSGNNRYKLAVCLRVTGVDSGVADLTHVYASLNDTGTGTGHTSPSVTTTETDCLVLSMFSSDNTATDTWSAAGTETEVADIQNVGFNGQTLAVFRKAEASIGAKTHSATQAPGGSAIGSMTWAIQPGGGAPGESSPGQMDIFTSFAWGKRKRVRSFFTKAVVVDAVPVVAPAQREMQVAMNLAAQLRRRATTSFLMPPASVSVAEYVPPDESGDCPVLTPENPGSLTGVGQAPGTLTLTGQDVSSLNLTPEDPCS